MAKSTNKEELYIAADTEAQTVINDEAQNHYVNVTLKRKRAELLHKMVYHPSIDLHIKLKHLEKKIKEEEAKCCDMMNTYLLGYAPIKPGSHVKASQAEWVKHNVKYWFEPNPNKSPWEAMLNDLVKVYGSKIKKGSTHRLIIYFHNLDYDAQHFLQVALSHLITQPIHITDALHNGTLYSVNFEYRNCVFELRDSMKIYNQSLAALGKNVGWEKQIQEATYNWFDLYRDTDKLNHEIYYFKFDIAVLAAVMREHFSRFTGKARLTAASYAERDLKKVVRQNDREHGRDYFTSLFKPAFTKVQDKYIRSAYFGGFVNANYKLLNTKLYNGIVADVNSLYPSVMLYRNYPDWRSVENLTAKEFNTLDKHDLNVFAIVTININSLQLKSDGVPVLPKKSAFGNNREIYTIDDLADHLITVPISDLYWIEKNYKITYDFIRGIIARKYLIKPFEDFILKHKKEKEDAVARHNKVDKMIAKIHLNSTYGKFAQRVIETKTRVILNDDNVVGFSEVPDPNANENQHNILIAVFITAFARDVLFSMIEIIKHEDDAQFWYCDTDAVHLGYIGKLDIQKDGEKIFEELHIPYSPNVFGKWKPEQRMSRAIYLGSKRYWEDDPIAGATIKGAGIQKQGKAYLIKQGFDKFHYSKNNPLVVPFTVSKKVYNGVKIFDSVKLIEPTGSQLSLLENYELIL